MPRTRLTISEIRNVLRNALKAKDWVLVSKSINDLKRHESNDSIVSELAGCDDAGLNVFLKSLIQRANKR